MMRAITGVFVVLASAVCSAAAYAEPIPVTRVPRLARACRSAHPLPCCVSDRVPLIHCSLLGFAATSRAHC